MNGVTVNHKSIQINKKAGFTPTTFKFQTEVSKLIKNKKMERRVDGMSGY